MAEYERSGFATELLVEIEARLSEQSLAQWRQRAGRLPQTEWMSVLTDLNIIQEKLRRHGGRSALVERLEQIKDAVLQPISRAFAASDQDLRGKEARAFFGDDKRAAAPSHDSPTTSLLDLLAQR